MSYATLSALFLGIAAIAFLAVALVSGRRPSAPAAALAAATLLALTAVFDTVMIGAGFFHYDDARLLGLAVGLAPIEDFAYPLAGAILLPAIWTAMRSRRRAPRSEEDDA